MHFSGIEGNGQLKAVLTGMVDSGRIPHAMMFYENDGCGAFALVQAFLQYLYCGGKTGSDSCGRCPACNKVSKMIHPDIHYIYPVNTGTKSGKKKSEDVFSETYLPYFRELASTNPYFMEDDLNEAIGLEGKAGSISINEAKAIISKLYLSPVENGYKSVVIYLPEKMNVTCANKLLKVIEEPPEKTIFLMITHDPDKVIQTIFSRCQSFRVFPMEREEIAATLERDFSVALQDAEQLSRLACGSVGKALWLDSENSARQQYMDLFSDFMEAVASRNLVAVLEVSEEIAALDSKEKQKAFISFAGEGIRKIFMYKQGLSQIAGISSQEMLFYEKTGSRFSSRFCTRSLAALDQAASLLARNVNQKMVFADLADRIFMSF